MPVSPLALRDPRGADPVPRVYVDFDDVLCETARGLSALLEAEFGKQVAYEEIRWFDLGRSFGLTADDLERLMRTAHRAENLASLRPVPGARAVLSQWRAQGCEVCIVTGRPPETADASREWLFRHDMPYDRLVFVDKYRRLPAGPELVTLDELARMGFALAIDDAPAMLQFLVEATPVPVVVYDRPWNAEFPAAPGGPGKRVRRCHSWAEIGGCARELLGRQLGTA